MNFQSEIKEYIELEKKILSDLDVETINSAIGLILETKEKGGTIYIFGNGGSAATASHFQNDFNKGLSEHIDDKFCFYCLSDNIATLTAIANDLGYEEVFRFQLKNKLKTEDLIIAISGSGNSKNVINAVEYAKSNGIKIIGLTGYDGGKLKTLSDLSINVPCNSMQITEDIHMVLDHLMMSVLYKALCGIEHVRC